MCVCVLSILIDSHWYTTSFPTSSFTICASHPEDPELLQIRSLVFEASFVCFVVWFLGISRFQLRAHKHYDRRENLAMRKGQHPWNLKDGRVFEVIRGRLSKIEMSETQLFCLQLKAWCLQSSPCAYSCLWKPSAYNWSFAMYDWSFYNVYLNFLLAVRKCIQAPSLGTSKRAFSTSPDRSATTSAQ